MYAYIYNQINICIVFTVMSCFLYFKDKIEQRGSKGMPTKQTVQWKVTYPSNVSMSTHNQLFISVYVSGDGYIFTYHV